MEDIIVVGGGPVGLMLALELALGGAAPVVVEARTEIDPTIKAGSLNGPAADALRRRRLSVPPRASASPVQRPHRFVGHVAGMPIKGDLVRFDQFESGMGPALVSQQEIQRMLLARLDELGVDVRQGVDVTGIEDHGDHITVHTAHGDLAARWVVGCDGGRSRVRASAGIGFPGVDGIMTGRQMLVQGTGLDDVPVGWRLTVGGVVRRMPNNLILTAEFDGAPDDRDAPITADEIEQSIERVTGVHVTVSAVLSATRFTDNTRVAAEYRHGRVLLAGDAAHVHPPFGGQGLSLGILDATDLGWRLAAVVTGRADESILDGYEAERRPEAERIVQWSRAQVGLMRTDERSRAAAALVQRFMDTPDGATEAVNVVSGNVVTYGAAGEPVGAFAGNWTGPDGELWDASADARAVVAYDAARVPGVDIGDRRANAFRTPHAPAAITVVRPDGVISWVGDDPAELDLALAALAA